MCEGVRGVCVVIGGMGLGVCSVCNSNWSYCQCISFVNIPINNSKSLWERGRVCEGMGGCVVMGGWC